MRGVEYKVPAVEITGGEGGGQKRAEHHEHYNKCEARVILRTSEPHHQAPHTDWLKTQALALA